MFWVISVQFNIRNTLPKFRPFLLGHPVFGRKWEEAIETWKKCIMGGFIIVTCYRIIGVVIEEDKMAGVCDERGRRDQGTQCGPEK